MLKKSQKGLAAVETVLILVIVALIGFVAWYAFHAKSNTDNTYNTVANTQTTPPKSSKKTTTTTPAASADIVTTKTDSKLGQYLADAKGMTLYTYGADTTGVSNCSGSCLAEWPIYSAQNAPATLPANVTVITRSDGSKQYAYKGMPLYYFTGDTSAGQVTGDGVNNFHVAKP
jgi:predicted lipoprotein with Yx(FWY)xxD motif